METLEELFKSNKFDYDNPDHILLADNHVKKILNINILYNQKRLKWLINYIIEKEYRDIKISIPFKFLIKEIMKTLAFESKPLKLMKIKSYPKIIKDKIESYRSILGYNGSSSNIVFHISNFRKIATTEGFANALSQLITGIYHELYHIMDFNNLVVALTDKKNVMSLHEYNGWKECLLIRKDHDFYQSKSWHFNMEVEAEMYVYEKAISFFKRYASKLYDEAKPYFQERQRLLSIVNIKHDVRVLNERLAAIVKGNPSIVEKLPFLIYEYNKDGSRLNLRTLLNFLDISKNVDNEVIKNLIIERIMEIDEQTFESYIDELYSTQLSKLYKIISLEMKKIVNKNKLNDECKECNILDIDIYDLGSRHYKMTYLYLQNYRDIIMKRFIERSEKYFCADEDDKGSEKNGGKSILKS